MPDPTPLDTTIAQLEAQRAALGDAAIDAAIQALRRNAGSAAPTSPARMPAADDLGEPGREAARAEAQEPAAAAAPRLRLVSVLFVDVADSTAMLQQVGTEDALALVGGAVEAFARIVQAHDGQVLRYTGDGLKAVFGSVASREDDAVRAVRAGLRIIEAAAEHAQRVARPLGVERFGVRVGIHSGMVLLGGGIEADHSAMGHAVHLAARLEQSAPVGQLRVSHATWQQVRGLFRAQAQPPLAVKGHDEPLRTYLVLGDEDASERTIRRGIEGVHAPMVGREAELQRLAAHLRHAAAAGTPAAALVLGEAGLGKTRLRRELLRRLEVVDGAPGRQAAGPGDPPVHCLRVRGQPSSALQPYGLLRQLLSRWLGIADDLAPPLARARLVEGLAPWLRDSGIARAQRVGQLAGLSFDDEAAVQALGARELREQAFGALHEALLTMAAQAPLLLVLEDLHWSDAGSLEFIERLLAPAEVPLLVLLVARPSFEPAWWAAGAAAGPGAGPAGAPPKLTLTLAHLPAEHGAALADALLAPLDKPPPALRALLIERATGNPFFMEELVRMMIDEGVIDTGARPWRVHAARLPQLRVPTTLVGVMQARLDALPQAESAALQQASILGPVFWTAALAALHAAAVQALPALMRRGLIVRRPGGAFAQTDEWAFQHQLLHDVTYATVLKAVRRAGHAHAARWLAARVGGRDGEFLAITAEHYERAGDSEHALAYYQRALSNAAARFAHESSLQFVERALAQPALVLPWQRFQLLNSRAQAYDRLERRDDWAAAHRAMKEWAELSRDDAMHAEEMVAAMLRLDHEGRPEEARALAEQVIALVGASGDPRAAAPLTLAYGELAWLATSAGDYEVGDRHLAQGRVHARRAALLPAEQGGYPNYELQLNAIAFSALLARRRHAQTLQAVQRALDNPAWQPHAKPHDRFIHLEFLHTAQRETGQLAAARATAHEALRGVLEMSMPRLHASALVHVADSALDLGDADAAHAAMDQALTLLARHNSEYARPAVLECQGRVAAARADWTSARSAWEQALQRFEAQGRAGNAADVKSQLAEADLHEGRLADAMRRVAELLGAPGPAGADAVAGNAQPAGALDLGPRELLRCLRVLEQAGDARAQAVLDRLRAQLDEQLGQCPDAAARERLLTGVPHWAQVQRRSAAAAPAAPAPPVAPSNGAAR
ncbi:MAG: AAA family ATPase [Rubrivivax sp.]|nr:AAA family ATPase [Rubrivivax sp.]